MTDYDVSTTGVDHVFKSTVIVANPASGPMEVLVERGITMNILVSFAKMPDRPRRVSEWGFDMMISRLK